jgi:hypothetical protein
VEVLFASFCFDCLNIDVFLGLLKVLSEIYIGIKWFGGRCKISSDTYDLVNIGVARLQKSVENKQGWFEVGGLISQEAVVEVLEEDKRKRWTPVIEAVHRLTPGATGNIGEDLVGRALVALSFSNITVADFARKFFSASEMPELPEWAESASLKLNRCGSPAQYACSDLPSFLEGAAAGNSHFHNALLYPSTVARPDGIAVCPLDSQDPSFYSVLYSSKLRYTAMPTDDIKPDRLSTELSKLYFLTTGKSKNTKGVEVNRHTRARCASSLLDLGKHVGSLRIHFILPRAGARGSQLVHRRK